MISRANLFTHPGGDSIQVQKTAEYLNRLEGVSVDMKTVAEDIDYSQYDLLHLFNISTQTDAWRPKSGPISPKTTSFMFASNLKRQH